MDPRGPSLGFHRVTGGPFGFPGFLSLASPFAYPYGVYPPVPVAG